MSDDNILGPQRVAAFLLSLDADTAKSVIGHLAPDVVEHVSRAMIELPDQLTEPGKADELHRELALSASGPKAVQACSEGELSSLLVGALGEEKAGEVLTAIRERQLLERPFLAVEQADPFAVGKLLTRESPAVAAVVIAHLTPSFSAAALPAFEDEQALEVIRLMASLTPPPFEVLLRIADRLADQLEESAGGPPPLDDAARLKTIAELLSNSAPEMEKSVIDAIQADNEDMANELRESLFNWEDIGTIDQRSMQKILGAVDTKTLAMSLKGSSKEVEENVMSNLSARVADMVKEEREMTGAVPMSEVLVSRDEVMRSVRALIDSGEFKPTRGGDDLVE
ncbi:MAG: FliG C-terminal domain-containing protein [Planctomycetota bacterium]